MKHTLRTTLSATVIALLATSAFAQELEPSHQTLPGGITVEKYYDGGSGTGAVAQSNIDKFDDMDFEIFTGQQWDRLQESHDENIVVTWPDGHSTTGIDVHTSDLKNLFVFAPDIRIESHPIRIGSGDWTSVVGVMAGTFTEPMPIGDGKFIEPTGKSFSLKMVTTAYWQNGVMVHEWLSWDNDSFYRQLGLRD